MVITRRRAKRLQQLEDDLKLLGINIDEIKASQKQAQDTEKAIYDMLKNAVEDVKKQADEVKEKNEAIKNALMTQEQLR